MIHMCIYISMIIIYMQCKIYMSIDIFYCMITFSLRFNASSMVRIG